MTVLFCINWNYYDNIMVVLIGIHRYDCFDNIMIVLIGIHRYDCFNNIMVVLIGIHRYDCFDNIMVVLIGNSQVWLYSNWNSLLCISLCYFYACRFEKLLKVYFFIVL